MSKRLPYPKFEPKDGERYWRSLREHDGSPEFEDELAREFPDGAAEPPDGVSRRDFFRVMSASFALAGVAACRRPDEKILPYARQPEEIIPGIAEYYATAMPWNGTAIGLLVESHEGRPTKIEGNPRHPESLGAVNTWAQASVLNLYDPDRSSAPSQKGAEKTWDDAAAALRDLGAKHKGQGGKGLAILTDIHRSPTTKRMLDEVKKAMPEARIVRYSPHARDNARQGMKLAFGAPYEQILHLDKARVVVSLDSDFLMNDGGSGVRHTKGFTSLTARRNTNPRDMNRLYQFESTFTVTGGMADHRIRLTSRQVTQVGFALAAAMGVANTPEGPALPEKVTKAIEAIVADLNKNRERSLVIVGEKQPPIVHALMAQVNLALGNIEQTLHFATPFAEELEGPAALMDLAKAIKDKAVTGLVILGGNPVFNAPADAQLGELIGGLEDSFHLSLQRDETSAVTGWHLNKAHFLESWDDVTSLAGLVSIVQPLIAPIFDGQTDAEVLSMLLGNSQRAYDLVRETHGVKGADAEKSWRKALHEGLIADSAPDLLKGVRQPLRIDDNAKALIAPQQGIEVTFVPDEHAWDGSYANNGWMQELPDPMTKQTWGNAALVSPATAKKLGIVDEELGTSLITLTIGGAKVTLPALIMPGQADDSLTVAAGQGRKVVGRVGKSIGVDVFSLRSSGAFHVVTAEVKVTGDTERLARTQEHFSMENRHVVREATVQTYAKEPDFAKKLDEPPPPHTKKYPFSLYPDYDYSKVQKWALAIDLNTCIGCNACVTACVSENNIAVVGKEGVMRTREMHWIRIDRYFSGSKEDPESVTQPMTCQQCENAPCETVCPVAATSHSPEGLNDMAYNRCIGTKYCLNNCPFKVRRFNYFNYAKNFPDRSKPIPDLRRAQFNPDVTVRSRGVMEKCTYCVQRIQEAKIEAHKVGKERVEDGRIRTACQQTCPADAIVFGDLNDPDAAVTRLKNDTRSYVLLEDLNVRPRTTYLAKIRNPNPEIG